MDKLTAIKIKYDDGTYSDEIPISVLSKNVEWDGTHTLVDILGSIDVGATGTIQDQISQLFNEKVSASTMQDYVTNSMPTYITNWLNTNVNPVGSAVVVDSSLTVSGAAADAKATGDAITATRRYTGMTRNLFNYEEEFSVTGTKEIPISIPAGTYVVSFESIVKTHQNKILIGLFDSTTNTYEYARTIDDGTDTDVVISIAHAASKIILYSNADWPLSQGVTTTFKKGQIISGDVRLPYVPYGRTAVDMQARADADGLKSAFDSLDFIGNKSIPLVYIEGEYINRTNGNFVPYTGWKRTNMIPIGYYESFETQATMLDNFYNAFYDDDKKFIKAFTISTAKGTLTRPSTAKYFAVSCDSNNVYTITGKYRFGREAILDEDQRAISIIEDRYTGMTRNLFNYEEEFSVTGTKEIPISIPAGTYVVSFESIVKTHQNKIQIGLLDSTTNTYEYASTAADGTDVSISVAHAASKIILYSNADWPLSQGVTTTFKKGQIISGDVRLPYVPYGRTAVDMQARADAEKSVKYPIPAYWENNISTAETTVNARKYTRSEHVVQFIFLTDVHWNNNAKQSPALVNRLCDDLKIPYVVFGGDVLTRHATAQYGINMLEQFYNKFDFPVISCVGNHDNNSDGKSDTNVIIPDKNLYAIMYRPFELFYDTDHTIMCGCFDDISQKVRYIQIDTGTPLWYNGTTTNIDETKLNAAFASAYEKIKELSSDWSVVLLTHMYFSNKTTPNTYVVNALNTQILANNYDATIVAMFVGHTHYDYDLVHTYNGKKLLVVSTMQDACGPEQNTESGLDMTKGTDTEQAFDIIEIDFTQEKVFCTRVGAGNSREFNFPD